MGTRGTVRMVASLFVLTVSACTSTDPGSHVSTPADEPSPTPVADVIEGMFDVGGHELYMRCSGTGSPTVVYLHGSIPDPAFQGHSSALAIQDIVDENHRMCVYDRANVGRSGSVDGPLDGMSTVKDLHDLLEVAGVEPPYVLLPASFGGLIADIYAATYPDDVVGMVQLDAPVPDTMEAMERFIPEEDRLNPGDWIGTNEEIDELAVFAQAQAVEEKLPAIPMTYLASDEPLPDPKEDAAWRALVREFVGRFVPGDAHLCRCVPLHGARDPRPHRPGDRARDRRNGGGVMEGQLQATVPASSNEGSPATGTHP